MCVARGDGAHTQIEECAALFSRSLPESERASFIQRLQTSADKADGEGASDAAARDAVSLLVKDIPSDIEGTDREIEGGFNMVISLLAKYFNDTDTDFHELCMRIVQLVSDISTPVKAAERGVVKYRILANVFNILPATSGLRLDVFLALLRIAAHNGDLDFLSAAVQSLPSWLAQWEVSPEKKHECLEEVADALESSERSVEYVGKAYQLELLQLRYVSSEPALSQETRHATAERAIASALRLPKLFEFDEMLHVPVVAELQGSAIFALLKIFVCGNRAELDAWLNSADAKHTIDRFKLQPDDLVHKMRLLDLAQLCVGSVSSEVSYDEIAKVLGVSDDAVESWVIDGALLHDCSTDATVIRAGLVSGKLSQVKRSFRVYRSTHRSFEKPQWETLEKRLEQWKSSVQSLLTTIRSTYRAVAPADGRLGRSAHRRSEPRRPHRPGFVVNMDRCTSDGFPTIGSCPCWCQWCLAGATHNFRFVNASHQRLGTSSV